MKTRKTLFFVIAALCCATLCALWLCACGGNNGDGEGDGNAKVGGTYYYCENDVLDDSIYITFSDGKFTDDEGETGSYTLSGKTITLFVGTGDGKIEFASGAVAGNDITLDIAGESVVYRKGEPIGSKPQTPTLEYALSADKASYTVKGIGGLTGDIQIPDEYKRKPVTEIAENAFSGCSELTGVTVGNNVVNIGKKSFYNCENLISAVLGESVEKIAEGTFENCKKLERVTVPASVKKFEYDAFNDCGALTDIYYTGTASDWAAIDFDYEIGYEGRITTASPFFCSYTTPTAGAKDVYRKLYCNGEPLTSANLSAATAISPLCFYRYKYLESASIGGTADEIGEYAFFGCENLTSLEFDGSALKTVGRHAFDGYCGITSVALPDSVNRIEAFAFNNCEKLLSLDTGSGAAYIGEGAFMGCEKLASLTLGRSVAEICETAFYGCNALNSVTIPSSAIFIGAEAFMYTGLASATFDNTTGWKVLKGNSYEAVENLNDTAAAAELLKTSILSNGYADYDWEKQTLTYTLSDDESYYTVSNDGTACRSEIVIPSTYNGKPVKALASQAFSGCSNLTSITIPNSVTTIGEYAFYNCRNLKSITIPSSVTTIGNSTFYGCENLTSISIPDSVTTIGEWAFYYCEGLTSITIPNSVTTIGEWAFCDCKGLTSITIGNGVTSIGEQAFGNCTSLTTSTYVDNIESWCRISSLELCKSIVYIGETKLIEMTSITIPVSVTTIGEYAFGRCTDLTSITIPDSVTTIGDGAFYDCEGLTSITIPDSVTTIGDGAFYDCTGLTSITIPNSVTSIGDSAFYCCEGLTSITIPDSVTTIGYETFRGCTGLTSITIPDSVTHIGSNAFNHTAYYNDKSNWHNGVLYIGKHLIAADNTLSDVTIKAGTLTIATFAFFDCSNLTSITYTGEIKSWCEIRGLDNLMQYGKSSKTLTIDGNEIKGDFIVPSNVTSIGDNAFYGCEGLTSITIPDSVTTIGNDAFRYCTGLTSITIPDNVTATIGEWAFYGCTGLTSIMIGNGVTSIGEWAFSDCTGLTSIMIGNGVTSIGAFAFADCGDGSISITFQGTKAQWNAIPKTDSWDSGIRNYTIHCTDGDIKVGRW